MVLVDVARERACILHSDKRAHTPERGERNNVVRTCARLGFVRVMVRGVETMNYRRIYEETDGPEIHGALRSVMSSLC